ncbi:MAG: DUF3106 domain-containing protein [Verrucomicrobia bacterium]|nr:DUF3106 domain-containing protein [Verrucomicrobiota bacterium]
MKTKMLLPIGFAGLLLAAWLHAAEPAPAAARPAVDVKEMAAVEQFLGLSDSDLEQMQQVIARIRAMKPEERAALRAEIARYRQLPDPQRQQLRQGWGWMPREIQDGWREMMQGATPERRTEIQNKMQSLPPEEKMTYRRQLVEEYLKAKAAKK